MVSTVIATYQIYQAFTHLHGHGPSAAPAPHPLRCAIASNGKMAEIDKIHTYTWDPPKPPTLFLQRGDHHHGLSSMHLQSALRDMMQTAAVRGMYVRTTTATAVTLMNELYELYRTARL